MSAHFILLMECMTAICTRYVYSANGTLNKQTNKIDFNYYK